MLGGFPEGGALIVGGSGGLGRAIARRFSECKVPLAVTYNSDPTTAQEVAAEAQAAGVKSLALGLDVRVRASVRQVLQDAADALGGLHSVIYAAGPGFTPEFLSRTPEAVWRDWVEVDVLGCIGLAQEATAHLRRTRGSFVTLSTYQGVRVEVRGGPSAVAKAALDRMVAVMAKEEGRYGVRANSVRAGWIATDGPLRMMTMKPGFAEEKLAAIPLGRLGDPNELADVVVFLCSASAGFISGVNLTVDGGESL
jgi:3-oxoacyl-[acyl-carrier protein] reductase